MTAQPNISFNRMADQVANDLVLRPLVESYLVNRRFPPVFNVVFRDEGKARKPDGFFHPSSHPMLDDRQLYYYMTEPDSWLEEELAYENVMAIMMGRAWHSFIQMCMVDAGILIKPTGTCVACGKEHGKRKDQCDEFGALDPVLKRRGHMDGILEIKGWGRGLLEFKTINPKAIFGLTDNNLQWLIDRHLDYYLQVQEYLEMTGMAKAIILFAVLGFPWKLIEIEVPFDHVRSAALKKKYESVRYHESIGAPPDACCGPRSKESKVCPARTVCPIAKM